MAVSMAEGPRHQAYGDADKRQRRRRACPYASRAGIKTTIFARRTRRK
jgi:hypothetical protein